MNGATETHALPHTSMRESLKSAAGSSMMEAAAAFAAMALAIVGLAGVFPSVLAAIAVIVFGAALIEGRVGGAFFASRAHYHYGTESAPPYSEGLSGEGLSAGFLGGVTGVILGVLALLRVAPVQLLSISAIVFGASFLLNGVVEAQSARLSRSGGLMLVGLAASILGILAVIGQDPLTMVLVSLLILGAADLFAGAKAGAQTAAKATT